MKLYDCLKQIWKSLPIPEQIKLIIVQVFSVPIYVVVGALFFAIFTGIVFVIGYFGKLIVMPLIAKISAVNIPVWVYVFLALCISCGVILYVLYRFGKELSQIIVDGYNKRKHPK